MAVVSVRYIVTDLDAALAFYTTHLGFQVAMRPAPTSRCCRAGSFASSSACRASSAAAANRCPTGAGLSLGDGTDSNWW